VPCAYQIIDEDRALNLKLLFKSPGMSKLLLDAPMGGKILSWMRLACVEENEDKTLAGIFASDRLKRWRRQRAIRSS
jgi:hypothetical protein